MDACFSMKANLQYIFQMAETLGLCSQLVSTIRFAHSSETFETLLYFHITVQLLFLSFSVFQYPNVLLYLRIDIF